MRELKFKREHFNTSGIHVGTTEWGKLERGYFASPSSMSDADETKAIDRQYTGLKDKNGVEIYEGDIVRWVDGDGTVSRIEWSEGDACFMEEPVANGFDSIRCEGFVIIGNIYESPELLNTKETNV